MTRFKENDLAWHDDLGHGKVLKCINKDNPEDMLVQGERYYFLDHKGYKWSVLSSSLSQVFPKAV